MYQHAPDYDSTLLIERLLEEISSLKQLLSASAHTCSMHLPGADDPVSPAIAPGRHKELPSKTMMPRCEGPRPPLPDPRLVRKIIRQRQARGQFFNARLFSDPAWDMMLDLAAAHAEHKRVSVTSLCIASGVPPTTALRWINQLVQEGIFNRIEDSTDRRRAFIRLSDQAAEAMARYFKLVEFNAPLSCCAR